MAKCREWLLEVWLIAAVVLAVEWSGTARNIVIGTIPFVIRRIAKQEARRG